jgi:hypothetical protein
VPHTFAYFGHHAGRLVPWYHVRIGPQPEHHSAPVLWRDPVVHVQVASAQSGGLHRKQYFAVAWARNLDLADDGLTAAKKKDRSHVSHSLSVGSCLLTFGSER